MKIGNKEAIIILVSAIVFISVVGYIAKATAALESGGGGYMILLDRDPNENNLKLSNFSTVILLASDNCQGLVNVCSFDWPADTDTRTDINKDGKIDFADMNFYQNAYGCNNGNTCWTDSFKIQECYFTYTGGFFKDPSGDCYINDTDLNMVRASYGATGNSVVYGGGNYSNDVNHDGIVDMKDIAIVGMNYGKYADTFIDYPNIQKKDLDLTGLHNVPDGSIDMRDIGVVASEFGKKADIKSCAPEPLISLGNGEYQVIASGYGLYSVGVAFKC